MSRDLNEHNEKQRPLRHTAFDVLDDLVLHGRAFTRAGHHYQERTPGQSSTGETHAANTDTTRHRSRRPPRRPPRGQNSHIDFEALSPAPYPAAHLRRIHRESHAFRNAIQTQSPQLPRYIGTDRLADSPSQAQSSSDCNLEPLRVVAERDASSRQHLKFMFRLATILWAILFVLTFCGYMLTLYMSKFWRVDKREQAFEIPSWVHEVTVVGLVLELVICIALGTRWRHYH